MTAAENRGSKHMYFDRREARIRAVILLVFLPVLVCVNTVRAQTKGIEEARRLFLLGSNQRAAQVLEVEVKSHPEESEAHLLLGQIYALEERRAESIHELSRAVELRPDSATSYNMLGTALSRFAEFEAARKAYEQAVALDPNLVDARINLGMSLAQANDMKGAVEQLTKAVELRPGGPGAARSHYLLGKIYENDDSQKAIHELEAASRIDPKDQQTWLHMGALKSESGDQSGALTALRRAVACDPRDAESQYELGSEYLAAGDARQATVHLQIARKLMPKATMALLYKLDRALRKSGDTAGAEQVRAQAQLLLTHGDDANQHFRDAEEIEHIAIELEQHGDLEHALEKYRTALEMNPQQDRYRYNYGLALCRLDRFREGIAALHEVLENDPGNIDARHALFIAEDKARQAARLPEPSKP
jgi:Flp pilus assembly protein TadD